MRVIRGERRESWHVGIGGVGNRRFSEVSVERRGGGEETGGKSGADRMKERVLGLFVR